MVIGKDTSLRRLAMGCILGLVAVAVVAGSRSATAKQESDRGQRPTIVLVHGDWPTHHRGTP